MQDMATGEPCGEPCSINRLRRSVMIQRPQSLRCNAAVRLESGPLPADIRRLHVMELRPHAEHSAITSMTDTQCTLSLLYIMHC